MHQGSAGNGDTEPAIIYDPTDLGFLADPYPVYRRLQQQCPVGHATLGDGGARVVSRFRDASLRFWEVRPPG